MKIGAILLLLFTLSCSVPAEKTVAVVNVTPEELNQLMAEENVLVVDIRTAQEVTQGQIKDALHFDFYDDNFAIQMGELPKDEPIALYCASGKRSVRAATELVEMGFLEVYDLQGGIQEWQLAGFEIIRTE